MLSREGRRRDPTQARSRYRQDRILHVAEQLISADGSEALRMNEVAAQAGISIGSLYQYYRDKGAILAALAERYHAESTACIEGELAIATDPRSLEVAFLRLMEIYAGLFASKPAMGEVWTAIQADKGLRRIEFEASKRNGEILAQAVRRCGGAHAGRGIEEAAFTIMALGEATMRLKHNAVDGEGVRIVDAYSKMATGLLRTLVDDE